MAREVTLADSREQNWSGKWGVGLRDVGVDMGDEEELWVGKLEGLESGPLDRVD